MSAAAAPKPPKPPKRATQAAAADGGSDGAAGHGGLYQSTPRTFVGWLRRDENGELLPPGKHLAMQAATIEHRVALVTNTTMDVVVEALCDRAFIRGDAAALAALHKYLGALAAWRAAVGQAAPRA